MARRNAAAASPAELRAPRSLLWLQGLACGALATLATPTAMLLAVLFGPASLAALLDRQPGRPIARCVALCSLSAIVGPVGVLWSAGHTMEAAITLACDIEVVALAWSAAAAGWLLAELLPVGVRMVLELASHSRIAALGLTRQRLEAEWGFPPATKATRNKPDSK